MLQRDILWSPADGCGMEHLRLTSDDVGTIADGLVIGRSDDALYRARYTIHCAPDWLVREVSISAPGGAAPLLHLLADGPGRWRDGVKGNPLPQFDDCHFVDISVTPFTNMLPIRHLNLKRGEQAEIGVIYIALPAASVTRAQQRYTCIEPFALDGGVYRYESLTTGFTVELPVDGEGIPHDYPGVWRRVWPLA